MSRTSIKNINLIADAIRRSVIQQKRLAKRQPGVQALDAPGLPDWWQDPAFAGLVPREDQEKDMQILISEWPNSAQAGETDSLLFQWKASTSENWQDAQPAIQIAGPLDPANFPMALTLNKANFAIEGAFDLRYRVTIDVGTTTDSDIARLTIDKTPPNNNQAPSAATFPDQSIVSDGITGEYLTTNGGVEILVPPYLDENVGDTVDIYVYSPGTSPTSPNHTDALDGNRQVKIPTVAFDGLLDGLIYVQYRLVDKVGNRGPQSENTIAGLFRNPLPVTPLAAPRVPRISDDNVLSLSDLSVGTSDLVEIDPYPNALERDIVELTWGGAAIKVIHEITNVLDKIVLNVGYGTTLAPAYGAATGVVSTPVSYVIKRGGKEFGSAVANIDVDFFVPGPVNPDRPDPVNPSLPQVTVRGTGPTAQDNVLNLDDAGLPVSVAVDLYDPIGPAEQMILYWASTSNEVGRFTPVAGTPGDAYTFSVAWDDIKDLPSSTEVPVFYTVGLASGSGNIESCEPTLVDVSAALPIKLSEPEFPDAGVASDGSPILNCTSFNGPDQLVTVYIPPNLLLKGGEKLTFTWQCYTDKLGQVPAGAALVTDRVITADEAQDGFEFTVRPFADYILPVGRNGSITLTYEADTVPKMVGNVLIRAAAQDAAGVCTPNTRRGFKTGGCRC